MGYFKRQLDKVYENDIDIKEVYCAQVVENNIANLSDEQFEVITDFVYDWVIHSQATPEEVATIISNGLGDQDIKKEMFFNSKGVDFITEYVNNRF